MLLLLGGSSAISVIMKINMMMIRCNNDCKYNFKDHEHNDDKDDDDGMDIY